MFRHAGIVFAFGSIFAAGAAMPAWAHGTTERVSVSSGGAQGNGFSIDPAISQGGRFVAFGSAATNLVPGDTNGFPDVFVHNRQTGATERVSVGTSGAQGNDQSASPEISENGRFVVFGSYTTNLVPGDTNGHGDIFVRDRWMGMTERVSVSSGGAQGNHQSGNHNPPSISAGGRFIAFGSEATNLVPDDLNGSLDVFVRDRQTGTTERVSVNSAGVQGNDHSFDPAISADGRFVAFFSGASNLVPGDTNGQGDIFVRDRQKGTTERVSVSSAGAQSNNISQEPTISADGGFVTFASSASNFVSGDTKFTYDVFVHNRQTGKTRRVSITNIPSIYPTFRRRSGRPAA